MGKPRKKSISDQCLHINQIKNLTEKIDFKTAKKSKSQTDLKPDEQPKPSTSTKNRLKQIIKTLNPLDRIDSKEYLKTLKRKLSPTCISRKQGSNTKKKPNKVDSKIHISVPNLAICGNEASIGEPMPIAACKQEKNSIVLQAAAFINNYERIYDHTLEKLDDIKFVMKENINKLIERDANLNDLELKAHNLNQNTLDLNLTSHKLKQKHTFLALKYRSWAVRISILFIIVFIIIFYIYKLIN